MRPPGRGRSKAKSQRSNASHVNNGVNRKQNQHRSPPRHPRKHQAQDHNGASSHHNDGYNSRGNDGYDARGYGYSFKGAANQSSSDRDNFTFRAGPRAPAFPQVNHVNNGSRDHQVSTNRNARGGHSQGQRSFNKRSFVPAHARALISATRRSPTPEQLQGMNIDGASTFKDVERLSDGQIDENGESTTHKRVKLNDSEQQSEETVAPNWSNPDPYTAMPAPGVTGRMDLIQAIRKAKVDGPAVVDNSNINQEKDYIAFDDVVSGMTDYRALSGPPANAPTMPKKQRLQQEAEQQSNNPPNEPIASIPSRPKIDTQASHLRDKAIVHGQTQKKEQGSKRKRQALDLEPGELISSSDEEDSPHKTSPPHETIPSHETSPPHEIDPKTPWFTPHKHFEPGVRLNAEIRDFYQYAKPTEQDHLGRLALIERVKNVLEGCEIYSYSKPQLHAFGSFATGVYLPTADMDLVALSNRFLETGRPFLCTEAKQINALAKYLRKSNIARIGSVAAITKSRVPLIKWIDRITGIRVDLSFENESGLHAIITTKRWIQQFPAMPTIVVIIKRILDVKDLNDVHTGGLGGFAIICLVVSMMQSVHNAKSDNVRTDDLLKGFLSLYGKKFQLTSVGIDMAYPQYFRKADRGIDKPNRLTLMDPNNRGHDVTGGSFNIVEIFKFFNHLLKRLNGRLNVGKGKDIDKSILGELLAGDFSTYQQTRQALHQSLTVLGRPPAELLPLPGRTALPKTVDRQENVSQPALGPELSSLKPITMTHQLPPKPPLP